MPASSHIPADVIDCIIDHLAVARRRVPDCTGHAARLQRDRRACVLLASNQMPLPRPTPAHDRLVERKAQSDLPSGHRRCLARRRPTAPAQRYRAREPGRPRVCSRAPREIDVHRLILRPASAFWDVVAHLSQHGGGITSVAVVGTTNAWGEPWRWLRNIEHDTQVAVFSLILWFSII